ncbi:hypothetical protein K3495_g2950 [Podosphaera aphanis]|nr:hypothetical protein K3495_g2950 [Podosphaera aphanis]
MRIPKAVNGIQPKENLNFRFCRSCKEAKTTRKISRQPMKEVSRPLERVDIDLCGPFLTRSWHGKRYMLTVTDQLTRFKWVIFQRDKKEIVNQIKKWNINAERDRDLHGNKEKLLAIRVNRGTEFLNKDMKDWTSLNNIELEPTVGYRPEANGIAERANRTIIEKENSTCFQAGLPAEYWELSFRAAVYLVEFDEKSFHHGKLPFVPNLNLLENESSDDEDSQLMTNDLQIRMTSDLDLNVADTNDGGNSPTIENIPITADSQPRSSNQRAEAHDSSDSQADNREDGREHLPPVTTPKMAQIISDRQQRTIARRERESERILKLQKQAAARGDRRSGRERKPTAKALEMQNIRQRSSAAIEQAFTAARDEQIQIPPSFENAIKSKDAVKRIEACESEMTSLVEHGTFSAPLSNIPQGKNLVTAKIVLDLKRGERHEILRYKARLVAR